MTNVTATLVFDSWIDESPERRGRKSEGRHLIYESDGILLDLLLKQAADESCIQVGGQILVADLSMGSAAGIVVQMKNGEQQRITQTNALGEFVFPSVPRLVFDLCFAFSNQSMHVRGVSFDEPHQWQVVPMMDARGAI